MISDLVNALKRPSQWLFTTWISMLIVYRATMLGPLWILLAPALFILVLGTLFSAVFNSPPEEFLPYFATGYILWGFISSSMNASASMYHTNQSTLLQGNFNHMNLVLRTISLSAIYLLHQSLIIMAIFLYFGVELHVQAWLAIPAITLMFIHSIWVAVFLSILGARYQDLQQVVDIALRVAFLATPIVWIPGEGQRGAVDTFLNLNPFYHVLQPIRGSLIGMPVAAESWIISSLIAIIGFGMAWYTYNRYRHFTILWI